MRNTKMLNYCDIRNCYELDDTMVGIYSSKKLNCFEMERTLEESLDEAKAYDIKRMIAEDLGFESNQLIWIKGKLYYGVFRVVGDLIYDLLASKVGLYRFDLESGIITSERENF